jgi:hypothetical protein
VPLNNLQTTSKEGLKKKRLDLTNGGSHCWTKLWNNKEANCNAESRWHHRLLPAYDPLWATDLFTSYLSLHALINILKNKAMKSWFPLVDLNDRSRRMQTKGS